MQYKSVILYHTEEKKKIAEQMIRELEEAKTYSSPSQKQTKPSSQPTKKNATKNSTPSYSGRILT